MSIVFVVLDANAANSIVSTVHDTAKSLAGPFDGIFRPHDPKAAIAINRGIALLVYLVIGSVLERLVGQLGIAARPRLQYD